MKIMIIVAYSQESKPMANKNQTSFRVTTTDSADIPRMRSAPSRSSATASAEIPTMQMAPGTQTKSSGQSSAGNGGGSGTPNSSNKK